MEHITIQTSREPLKALWIWKKQANYNIYNQTVIARKAFSASNICKAFVRITADSYYRLYINNKWINDGPSRSWPEHFQYDVIDVTEFVQTGSNELKVIARYYGTGTHHQVPKQAGLLAQLDIVTEERMKEIRTILDERKNTLN